ncbi:hypothetical protein L7F22_064928 [Adiantum nelumboides]|nr:hypothetical protein [Adiantum nelumboides]
MEVAHACDPAILKKRKGGKGDQLEAPVKTVVDKFQLLPAFLKVRGLVKQHIDSFNYFVNCEIKKIIHAKANEKITSDVDPNYYIKMDPAKVEAIKSRPDLKTVHDVRSFLGLCSYYRRFIRNFAEIASPLHALQKKAVTFGWTQKEISAFNLLNEKMTSDPVIVLPDLRKSFVVQCDACGSSIGAVLMQDGRCTTMGVEELSMLSGDEINSFKAYLVIFNGLILGVHRRPMWFANTLRLLRRLGKIGEFVSIFTNPKQRCVYVASDGGRVCRPLVIADHGV